MIRNILIINNTGYEGGGVYSVNTLDSILIFNNCNFINKDERAEFNTLSRNVKTTIRF